MIRIIAIVMFLLTGCATLKSKVINDINVGDSSNKVSDVLGEPYSSRTRTDGSLFLVYREKRDLCGVALIQEKVTEKDCIESSSYYSNSSGNSALSVFGTILQGAGQGLQNASQRPPQQIRSCQTVCDNGYCNTNCN